MRDWAVRTANFALHCVVRAIHEVGLTVAERKTKAIFFHPKGMKPPQTHLRIGRIRVPVEAQMRYLGLIMDGTRCFKEHFSRLVPRLKVILANLGKLMPNIGRSAMKARRLHAGNINSVALYGVPIWAETPAASRPLCAVMRRAQRTMTVREDLIRKGRTPMTETP
ncbi:uncharacterized protein LOC105187108 [Harpegnathos saltator]|uniref:uncharacterized protein LOC105187108 n=1 Tax=Harpegnathos saltator TaxID=610380 RepID=UPI00058D33F1|nr:uncharacterized protein LOC105187108 [Harpegnathos saltator]